MLAFLSTVLAHTPSGFDYEAAKKVFDNHIHMGAQLGVPGTVVGYTTMEFDPNFKRAIDSLAKVDLSAPSLNESFALGCDAYNLFAFKMVIDNACRTDENGKCLGPIFGLDDIPDWAHMEIHNLGGKKYSLHQIEGMMRPVPSAPLFDVSKGPVKEDLRVHACLICGGISCPDVRFYSVENIDNELTSITKSWMANPYKGMKIDKKNNVVTWSMIMSWYHEEFVAQGGIEKSMSPYFTKEAKEFFAHSNGNYTEEYLGYVWDSNGPVPCSCLPDVTDPNGADSLRDHASSRVPSSHIKESFCGVTNEVCENLEK